MRGKSSSSKIRSMEAVETPRNKPHKEEPHLSGAYIRSLVKQLSSSTRPKEPAVENPSSPNSASEDRLRSPPPQPHQPKKQVRRRLHVSRPYQERLLNMAEARREIVTALKFHRAAMKQASEQPPPTPSPEQSHSNPHQPPFYELAHHPNFSNHQSTPNPILPQFTYPTSSWPYPSIAPSTNFSDNFNLPGLPNQPLGLNLNFQGFNNINTPLYNTTNNNKNPPIMQPLSPPSSSSSYSSPPAISGIAQGVAQEGSAVHANTDPNATKSLHPAMDEKEMAEIRSIVEKHDMEWNDTVNLVTSAWWSNFLETMEVDSVDEIPTWLRDGSAGEAIGTQPLMHQHVDDYHMHAYDASLPCFDIGEIEGLDGEWLS